MVQRAKFAASLLPLHVLVPPISAIISKLYMYIYLRTTRINVGGYFSGLKVNFNMHIYQLFAINDEIIHIYIVYIS